MSLSAVTLQNFLEANPQAQQAALHDPEFAADVARLRTVLDQLDAALDAEGLDSEARRRVGARLVGGCLLTDKGRAEQRERERLMRSLSVTPPFA
ncbi:hypothetical protein ACIQZB_00290 [Streptomyces sp. NPDC097727]|uniref:hypothetical protein n=1 Tax=Streptomyces sp. NPDC097727 TaxID=3366092 RepID=UPI0038246414